MGSSPTAVVPPAAPVVQFNGNRIRTPTKRAVSRLSGFTFTIDPRWANGYGYRPIEVTIASPKPTNADHVITVQLHTSWMRNVSVDQQFDFPAGSTTATTTIAFPTYNAQQNNYFWWDVFVDGIKDRDLSVDRVASFAFGGGASGSASLSFLTAGSLNSNRVLVASNQGEFEALTLALANFPTRWIDYTTLDVVTLSRDELTELAAQRPAAFEAICRWARAGGQLWISDAGQNWEHLPEISKLIRVSDNLGEAETPPSTNTPANSTSSDQATPNTVENGAKQPSDATPDDAPPSDTATPPKIVEPNDSQATIAETEDTPEEPTEEFVGWRPLRLRRSNPDGQVITFRNMQTGQNRVARDPEEIARLQQDSNFEMAEQRFDPEIMSPMRRFPTDSSDYFVQQPVGLGFVRAFRGKNEVQSFALAPPTANPNVVANSDAPDKFSQPLNIGLRRTERWDWRHGMTPDSPNSEFAKFLVPGVGLAPVTEFEVLITLFVLLIGPVNYWLLKRHKRLYLMVLTVPLAAAITTLALFTYAILADGFATRVRAQSYTALDQRIGEAVCWSRLSYYSGLAPSGGLTMPTDVAMYPILPGWARDTLLTEERKVLWGEPTARLTQGWLSSRTPTQYLTLRSRKSDMKLEVLEANGKMRVKNGLGTDIKLLVVHGASGGLYFSENIATGSGAALDPITRADATRRLSKLVVENAPRAPEALATSDTDFANSGRSRRFSRYGMQFNTGGRLSDNLSGRAIASLAGLGPQSTIALPPRTYVAVTETGPEVEYGMTGGKEEASFHVIEGKW